MASVSAADPIKNCEPLLVLEQQPIRVSRLAARLRPNRILVVTCLDRQDRLKEQQQLRQRVTEQIRTLSTYDAIEYKRTVCDRANPIHSGKFDERQLVAWANQYSVDSILFCQVNQIDAYRPMRIEIEFLLLNADQAVAVVSGTMRYDLADSIAEKIYLQSISADREDPFVASSSPSRFIEFSAEQLALRLKSLW